MIAPCSRTTVYSANTEALANWKAGTPLIVNGFASFGLGAFLHSVGWPASHLAQRPQCESVETMTVSPSLTERTPTPTASITPAPSCPSTTGTG